MCPAWRSSSCSANTTELWDGRSEGPYQGGAVSSRRRVRTVGNLGPPGDEGGDMVRLVPDRGPCRPSVPLHHGEPRRLAVRRHQERARSSSVVDDRRDYTGWTARWIAEDGPMPVGTKGVVTGFEQTGDRSYTVTFTCDDLTADVVTHLPASGDIDLIAPSQSAGRS